MSQHGGNGTVIFKLVTKKNEKIESMKFGIDLVFQMDMFSVHDSGQGLNVFLRNFYDTMKPMKCFKCEKDHFSEKNIFKHRKKANVQIC